MLLRAIRYCSTLKGFLNERAKLRMALLINKYPGRFIDDQFNRLLHQLDIKDILTNKNYNGYREKVINSLIHIKQPVDHRITMFVHFTYCTNMTTFPKKFHDLWYKYFSESPINDIVPV